MPNPITAENLAALGHIRHGFFTRAGGASGGIFAGLNCGLGSSDERATVLENRRRVARHLGALSDGVVTLYQEHGATALAVAAPITEGALPRADAVVTATPGLAIGVLTADCAPVLFADSASGVVAAAHAGWRGAVSGILEAALTEMERLGADRRRIHAAVGPSIGRDAYEVGPEFEAEFLNRDPESRGYFVLPAGGTRCHFDLTGYAAHRLARAGVSSIVRTGPCTHDNESILFSYRRSQSRKDPDYGRQISAIVVA
ncbi:MAG: peptidoglycan editing factor PgeF [Hyphomicrobium sp.]